MSDHPTTEAGRAAATSAAAGRSEPPEDLAAIIERARQLGIAAWRVETALGIPAPPAKARGTSGPVPQSRP